MFFSGLTSHSPLFTDSAYSGDPQNTLKIPKGLVLAKREVHAALTTKTVKLDVLP